MNSRPALRDKEWTNRTRTAQQYSIGTRRAVAKLREVAQRVQSQLEELYILRTDAIELVNLIHQYKHPPVGHLQRLGKVVWATRDLPLIHVPCAVCQQRSVSQSAFFKGEERVAMS